MWTGLILTSVSECFDISSDEKLSMTAFVFVTELPLCHANAVFRQHFHHSANGTVIMAMCIMRCLYVKPTQQPHLTSTVEIAFSSRSPTVTYKRARQRLIPSLIITPHFLCFEQEQLQSLAWIPTILIWWPEILWLMSLCWHSCAKNMGCGTSIKSAHQGESVDDIRQKRESRFQKKKKWSLVILILCGANHIRQ